MGNVYAEITMRNLIDLIMARTGHLKEENVRETTVSSLVDTRAYTLVISEAIRVQLGLEIRGDDWIRLANGEAETVKKVDPVEVQWDNRTMTCQPVVLSGTDEVLLGAIPLEEMDLIVDPKYEQLVGRHGSKIIHRI